MDDQVTGDATVSSRTLLRLTQMEMALVKAHLAHPNVLTPREYAALRYLLGLSRITRFAPGAALGEARRGDVWLEPAAVAPLREFALKVLYKPLRRESQQQARLTESTPELPALRKLLKETRTRLLRQLDGRVRPEELDAEAGRRALVSVAGGGGGAGFVYVGAYARLQEAGLVPKLIVGSSIGALLGGLRAQRSGVDVAELTGFAKALRMRDIFGAKRPPVPTYTLPGLMRLHLDGVDRRLRHADGRQLRLRELEIPYVAVVGGLRKNVYESLLRSVGRTREKMIEWLPFSARVAERMWNMTTYFTPGLVKEITLGRNADTAEVRVMDAIGLSAAIPGVLQYEPQATESGTHEILESIRRELKLAAFVDGGVANNVPVKTAWQMVQGGRIGTRNAFYLAFDCFAPQLDPQHAWLYPVTQIAQLQMPANRPYLDWLVRFKPTLSPVNLLPGPLQVDQAVKWGWDQMDAALPVVQKALEPAPWME